MVPRLPAAGLMLVGALAASACGPLTTPGSSADAAPARGPAAAGDGTALAHLNNLKVQARTSLAGYSRDAFGPAWSDAGTVEMSGNSCPTRQDALARDLDDIVRAEDGCTVLPGVLHDWYTGRTIHFKRGPRRSMAVQIDHVVPLALGWRSGARELTAEQRLSFANDLANLVATDGPRNAGKGAKDASAWTPPRAELHLLVRDRAGPRENQVPPVGEAVGEDGPAHRAVARAPGPPGRRSRTSRSSGPRCPKGCCHGLLDEARLELEALEAGLPHAREVLGGAHDDEARTARNGESDE